MAFVAILAAFVAATHLICTCDGSPLSPKLTCYTCHDKSDNEDCNNWAPNLVCPQEDAVCETVHRFTASSIISHLTPSTQPRHRDAVRYAVNDSDARLIPDTPISIRVDKLCVQRSKCRTPGCYKKANVITECVTCCDTSYCNEQVAVNQDETIRQSFASGTPTIRPFLHYLHLITIYTMLLIGLFY